MFIRQQLKLNKKWQPQDIFIDKMIQQFIGNFIK